MKATTEYGVQITRPGKDPITYPCDDLADAHEVHEDWAATPATPTSTYTVVSRTVAVSDWVPVARPRPRP